MNVAGRDRLLTWTGPALVGMVLAVLAVAGAGEGGVRMAIRATARTSAAFLCLALASHALADLHPLARRRPGLVRSLAVSHALHLAFVVWLAWLTSGENLRARASVLNVVGSLLAYAVLAGALFRPESRRVDRGLVLVWLAFAAAYAPRAMREPVLYGPIAAALAAALVLRVAGAFAHRPLPVPREDLAT